MMKKYVFISIYVICFSSKSFSVTDSLYPFTEKEILKLSNLIYELEKKDSLASANEPNGFLLKNRFVITDSALLVDTKYDSIHYYTGKEIIKLSNYIYELEQRNSLKAIRIEELKKKQFESGKFVEFHLDEERDIQNFESVVFFSFNSSSITSESYMALNEIIKILKTYINLTFVIEGSTDNAGSPSYNKVLSTRRAKAVKEYFVAKGIKASRIISVAGYGGSKYMYPNTTEEGRAKNRNVIIKAYH